MTEQPKIPESGKRESIESENLDFGSLCALHSEVNELAERTFRQTDDGFVSALGERISIYSVNGKFLVEGFLNPKGGNQTERSVHAALEKIDQNVRDGHGQESDDKAAIFKQVRIALEEIGARIIE